MPNNFISVAIVASACILVMLLGALVAWLIKHAGRKKETKAVPDRGIFIRKYLQSFSRMYPELDLSQNKVLEEIMNEALDYIRDADNDLEDVRLAVSNIEKRMQDFGFEEEKFYVLYLFFQNLLMERDWNLAMEFSKRHPIPGTDKKEKIEE